MVTLLSDSQSDPLERLNRIYYRDRGMIASGVNYGENVTWTPDISDYAHIVDNVQGNHADFGTGKLTITDSAVTAGIHVIFADGAVGTPGWGFTSDTDVGAYYVSSNIGALVANGAICLEWNGNTTGRIIIADGVVGTPGWSFLSDTDVGAYYVSSNVGGLAANGGLCMQWSGTTTPHIIVANGLIGTPGWSFASDTAVGGYYVAANTGGLVAGATSILQWKLNTAEPSVGIGVAAPASGLHVVSTKTTSSDVVLRTDGGSITSVINARATGIVLLGTATLNSLMTMGLTINQAGNDNEIFALQSTDVAHGMTDLADTTTYLNVQKSSATNGEPIIQGFGASTSALRLYGDCTTGDTTKSTSAAAPVHILGRKKSGTSATAMGANENLAVISSNGTVKVIFDADGDINTPTGHTTLVAFDAFDDIQLVRALDLELHPDQVIRDEFDDFITYRRADLEAAGLVTFNDRPGQDGVHFMNLNQWIRLHNGTLWQLHKATGAGFRETDARLAGIERRLLALEAGR